MRVAVVGLGLAGLRTMDLLAQAGVQAHGFEARARLGGRIETVREPNDVVFDAGAEWIDADHDRVIALCSELGVALESPRPTARTYFDADGHCVPTADFDGAWAKVDALARERCATPDPAWDAIGVDVFLDELALSATERALVDAHIRSDEGEDPERVGAVGWLEGYRHYLSRGPGVMSAHRVAGGSDRLIDALACRVPGARLGCPLRALTESTLGVTLTFDDAEVEFDRVVLALPAPLVERLTFTPPRPPRVCEWGRAIKVVWQFEEDWWSGGPFEDAMFAGMLQQTWDAGRGQEPVLAAYCCGSAAETWLSQPDPAHAAWQELARHAPDARRGAVRSWVAAWPTDPWALGGFSFAGLGAPPGPGWATPHGRTHFAGEHTAAWSGFLEGALESAERVAREVLADGTL